MTSKTSRRDTLATLNQRKWLRKVPLAGAFLNVFFPNMCPLCNHVIPGDTILCSNCLEKLLLLSPFPAPLRGRESMGKVHVYASYDSILGRLVRAYKFGPFPHVSRFLAFFAHELYRFWLLDGWIVPVPPHPASLRVRGFSNTGEICTQITRQYDSVPVASGAVRRRHSRYVPQSTLQLMEDRQKNIRGAFQALPGKVPQNVVLFDDVMTGGFTLSELSKTLQPVTRKQVGLVLVSGQLDQ